MNIFQLGFYILGGGGGHTSKSLYEPPVDNRTDAEKAWDASDHTWGDGPKEWERFDGKWRKVEDIVDDLIETWREVPPARRKSK